MSLQDLAYEISYNTNESGLMKSVELINSLDASLDGMVKKVDSIANAFSKFNTPINNLGKSTSDLNVDNLSNSLKNATSNATELNASTERQQRLTEMVNKYADEYNSKIDESSKLAEQLNNRTANLSAPVEKMVAEQQRLNQEIFEGVENENKFASVLNKVQEGMSKGAAKANEFSSSLSGLRSISSGMSGVLGALGFIGVGYTAVAGIKEATTAFMDFQQQMAGVHATLGEVTNKDLTKLGNKAIEVSNKYAISSKEIAAGEENLASAGFDAKQVMDSLEASTLLSVAGNIKMQESTLDIAAAIRNFNMETSQAAHVADIYAKAAADTSAAMSDMAFAMKYIAPVANQAGWSIESTAAAVGVLANAGIKSTSAGTGLRRMFTRLINPTDKAAEKMKELGFEAIDPTTHKIKDIGTLIQDLQGSMKGLDSASKGAALSLIFGVEGLTPMSALMNSSKDEIDKLTKSFQDSDGAAQKMADTMNDTVAGSLGLFKTNIENAFITDIDKSPLGKSLRTFIDDLNKNLPDITNNIAWILNTMVDVGSTIKKNWGGIASIIFGVAGAFIILKGAMAVGDLVKTVGALGNLGSVLKFAGGVGLLAAGFMELKQGNTGLGSLLMGTGAGLMAVSLGFGALSGLGIGAIVTGFIQLKQGNTGLGSLLMGTGLGLLALAGGLALVQLFALPVTWPIYLIAGAVAVLAAGLIYLHEKFGSLSAAWAAIWGSIKQTAIDGVNVVIEKINGLITKINGVITTIDKIPGINIPTIKALEYVGDKKKETKGKNLDKATGLPAAANGMVNSPGGVTLVGEKGPELVNLPKGADVTTASKTNKMLSGSFAQMGTGTLGASAELNSSAEKVIADNQKIITGYVDQHKLYGRDSVENFSVALLQNESLSTNATSTLSTDNKNIMNNLSLSGYTYGSGVVNNLAQGVQANEGNLTTVVQTLTDKVIETFKSGFGIHSPSTVMYSMGSNLLRGLVNGMTSKDMGSFIQNWIGSMTGAAGGAMSGSVTSWLATAMAITGTPMSFLPLLQNIAMHESGGNPNSINLWDSNAAAGHPSKGLMQMIDETFNRWALPGMNDIWNPIHNAVSSIRYMIGRYGSIANVPGIRSQLAGGAYVGYEEGTRNATPGVHLVGEKGPELVWMKGGETVTPNDKISIASQTPYATSNNVSTQLSPSVIIHIHESKDPRATADEVLRVLKKHFGPLFDDKMADLKIQMGLS